MVEDDTIKLLKECDAGIKMGVSSIDDVLDDVKDEKLKKILMDSKDRHEALKDKMQELLKDYQDDGKEPHPVAKAMSKMKINMKLTMDDSDNKIADLIFDGCNMGVKSLFRYLNQYQTANDQAKSLTKETIEEEENLRAELAHYL